MCMRMLSQLPRGGKPMPVHIDTAAARHPPLSAHMRMMSATGCTKICRQWGWSAVVEERGMCVYQFVFFPGAYELCTGPAAGSSAGF